MRYFQTYAIVAVFTASCYVIYQAEKPTGVTETVVGGSTFELRAGNMK